VEIGAVYKGFCKPQSCQKQKDNYSTACVAIDISYTDPAVNIYEEGCTKYFGTVECGCIMFRNVLVPTVT